MKKLLAFAVLCGLVTAIGCSPATDTKKPTTKASTPAKTEPDKGKMADPDKGKMSDPDKGKMADPDKGKADPDKGKADPKKDEKKPGT